MVKIYNSGDMLQTNLILATLKQNHIAAYGKEVGANSYMQIAGAMSVTGTDIYVDESAAERAKEIIESIVGTDGVGVENAGVDDAGADAEEQAELRRNEWKKRLFAVVMLVCILAALVAGLILS